MYIYIYVYVYVYIYMYMCICICMCICIYVYVYMYMYICICIWGYEIMRRIASESLYIYIHFSSSVHSPFLGTMDYNKRPHCVYRYVDAHWQGL